MKRRDFLIGAAAGATVTAGLTRSAIAQGGADQSVPLDKGAPAAVSPAKLARISIMTYNFTSRLKLEGQAPNPDRILDLFDIPQLFADTYGVEVDEREDAVLLLACTVVIDEACHDRRRQ